MEASTIKRTTTDVVRYGASSSAGLALNMGLLVVLVETIGVPKLPAAALSVAISLTLTFLLTEKWVFKRYSLEAAQSTSKRLPAYYATMVGSKALNFGVYTALLTIGVWYPLAWFSGSALIFLVTFTVNKRIWRFL
jgi:putative flippase GtrA